jgi:hypothetical protein
LQRSADEEPGRDCEVIAKDLLIPDIGEEGAFFFKAIAFKDVAWWLGGDAGVGESHDSGKDQEEVMKVSI